MNTTKRPHITAVSGLRFLAALHVLAYHASLYGFLEGVPLSATARAIVGAGYTTTSMFLVLSGFMLYYAYVGDDGRLKRPAQDLWWSRFATLYPIAVVGQLLGLPRAFFGTTPMEFPEIAGRLGAALTLTQAWIPTVTFTFDGPSWTLSCLAFFYAIFPWLVERVRLLSARALLLALVACWVVAQGIAWTYLSVTPHAWSHAGTPESDPLAVFVHAFPLVRFWEFFSGVLLARLLIGGVVDARVIDRVRRSSALGILAVLLVTLSIVQPRLPFIAVHSGVTLPIHWMLIASLALSEGALVRVLGWRPVAALGETSLPLFLLHVPALQYLKFVHLRGWLPNSPWVTLAWAFVVITACHYFASRFVQPLAKRIRARAQRGPATVPSPTLAPVVVEAAPPPRRPSTETRAA